MDTSAWDTRGIKKELTKIWRLPKDAISKPSISAADLMQTRV
jgi:hypothetical protein